ncbi:hypothetical protein [Deinococcus misasensis]|uniref:hypothetical protein n=1 Tax=Deinococcus misasensis TaxID=392413 RepID=UPI000554273E|nr:hypothetical protein [Deinococcus misasensis]
MARKTTDALRDRLDKYPLTPHEHRVVSHLITLSAGTLSVQAGIPEIARRCLITEDTARKTLHALLGFQVVSRLDRPGRKPEYTIRAPAEWLPAKAVLQSRKRSLRGGKRTPALPPKVETPPLPYPEQLALLSRQAKLTSARAKVALDLAEHPEVEFSALILLEAYPEVFRALCELKFKSKAPMRVFAEWLPEVLSHIHEHGAAQVATTLLKVVRTPLPFNSEAFQHYLSEINAGRGEP